MNIHEHQAKQILKKFGAIVPEGVFGFTAVSYTHLRAHETPEHLVCRLVL